MTRRPSRPGTRRWIALIACADLLAPGGLSALALAGEDPRPPVTQTQEPGKTPAAPATAAPDKTGDAAGTADATQTPDAPKLTADQLDSLVAPIALYPDALLAQTLVASTYPLEIVQLQQWLAKNPKLKDKALADAVAKQPWDASIQSMAPLPDLVKRLADDVQWTTDMGNAFLAQQSEVMDAVQRMRKKAQDKGTLESNEQQKVSEKKVEEKTVIVVESANPEVIYVPSYSPTVVYGAPMYPYPPIYYPPYPPGAAFMSFTVGVMWGAAIWGGGCCGCGWGGNDIDINVNNNFNRNEINTGGNRGNGGAGTGTGNRGGASAGTNDRPGGAGGGGGGQKWSHNPEHRGGTPYADKGTANKYGGNARGDSLNQRQSKAGQQGGGNRAGGGPSAGTRDVGGGGAGSRPGGGSGGLGSGGGGGDKVGNRNVGSSSGRQSGFGGGSGGFSGSSARASSSRGSSSMGGRSFGGGGGGRRR